MDSVDSVQTSNYCFRIFPLVFQIRNMNINEFSLHQHTCDITPLHMCLCVHTLPYILVTFLFLFLRMNFSNPMSLRTFICSLERDSKVSLFIIMSLYSKSGYFSCRHLIDRWKWLFLIPHTIVLFIIYCLHSFSFENHV